MLLTTGCGSSLQRFEYTAVVMAAEARVVLYAPNELHAREAARAAIERMHALDRVMSDYRADSELSALVAAETGRPHAISRDLYEALAAAQRLAALSDGAFDATIGPLTRLWREARATGNVPDAAAIDEARQRVGWINLILDEQSRTAMLLRDGMQLDLGGIGKGFAVDRAGEVLRQQGITRYFVALAGDIAVGDAPPRQPAWRIAIGEAEGDVQLLTSAAISTSGSRYQYLLIEGSRRSHIIDPAAVGTLGIERQSAVTVIAPSATLADGIATALSVVDDAVRDRLLRHYNARVVD